MRYMFSKSLILHATTISQFKPVLHRLSLNLWW